MAPKYHAYIIITAYRNAINYLMFGKRFSVHMHSTFWIFQIAIAPITSVLKADELLLNGLVLIYQIMSIMSCMYMYNER